MRIITPILIILVLNASLLGGCSSRQSSKFQKREVISDDFPRGSFDEDQRQKMFEERQQQMIEACQGKNDGENCQLESIRENANLTGICQIQDDNLVCKLTNLMRQRRE